ncbi:peroxiredoxin [soil metagenome]
MKVGDKAVDFTLYDTNKQAVSLNDYKGKNVLLLFFPLAFTSVCTEELCNTRDTLSYYDNVNAVVLGISVDSLYTLGKFKETLNINFPLLSDFNKETSINYGSLYETFGFGMKGVSKRSAFVIDKEGVICYAEVLENAGDQPDFQAIQHTLIELQKQVKILEI